MATNRIIDPVLGHYLSPPPIEFGAAGQRYPFQDDCEALADKVRAEYDQQFAADPWLVNLRAEATRLCREAGVSDPELVVMGVGNVQPSRGYARGAHLLQMPLRPAWAVFLGTAATRLGAALPAASGRGVGMSGPAFKTLHAEIERLARRMCVEGQEEWCHPDTLVFCDEPLHLRGSRYRTVSGIHQIPAWQVYAEAASVAVAEYRPDLLVASQEEAQAERDAA